MVKIQDFSPFLFPSSVPSYASESTPQSPLSSSPSASRSTSSLNSPCKSSPSVPGPLLSQSSSVHPLEDDTDAAASGPCAACKINGRRCSDRCYLASYFPSNEAHKFGVVDTVFGWDDLQKFLQLQEKSNSSNYIPLLVLLRDTSQEEEVQSNPKNCGHNDNQIFTLPSNSSANTYLGSWNNFQFDPSLGGMFGYNHNITHHLSQQFHFPTITRSPREVPQVPPIIFTNPRSKKVKVEKLGDKVTALQLLVSPWGKSDTASVFLESIRYITFLHEQVMILSNSYIENGAFITHQQIRSEKLNDSEGQNKDLRSRGLCLAPLSFVFPVAYQ